MTSKVKEVKTLGRDDILDAKDYTIETAECWGGVVRLRSLSGASQERYQNRVLKQGFGTGSAGRDMTELNALLLTMVIVDDNDELIFDAKDIPKINSKSSKSIMKLIKVVHNQNGMGDEGVDEAEKN